MQNKAFNKIVPETTVRMIRQFDGDETITTGCTQCLEQAHGLSVKEGYEWGKAHQCETPVCPQCHQHIATWHSLNDQGICEHCTMTYRETLNGKTINQTMLSKAFDLVRHPQWWKYPCEGMVNERQLPLVEMAINYMAGGGVSIQETILVTNSGLKIYRVTAPGYYALIGS